MSSCVIKMLIDLLHTTSLPNRIINLYSVNKHSKVADYYRSQLVLGEMNADDLHHIVLIGTKTETSQQVFTSIPIKINFIRANYYLIKNCALLFFINHYQWKLNSNCCLSFFNANAASETSTFSSLHYNLKFN